MKPDFIIENEITNLPPAWDDLTVHYFQKLEFLRHAAKYNPCRQRYYLLYYGDSLAAAAVVYTLTIDLLTNLRLKSPLRMHIAGIPCSVSCPGIIGKAGPAGQLAEYIFEKEKGFVLALNLETKPDPGRHRAGGYTLPGIVLDNTFSSAGHYISSLRSDYRRRWLHINKEIAGLKLIRGNCSEYTEEHYRQYLEVFRRSKGKLEKLSPDFFKYLPQDFLLTSCLLDDKVIGWNITILHGDYLYFFLGGIDYKYNKSHSIYLRMLANIVKQGIDQKAHYIDLGQTAEIPKLKTGAVAEVRYMEARHSNVVFNRLLKSAQHLLTYKYSFPVFHVFKENAP